MSSVSTGVRRVRGVPTPRSPAGARERVPAQVVAAGLVVASLFGFLAGQPYVGVDRATVTAAHAQDVCSLLVAVLLVLLARHGSARAHLVRLGLMGYVAYSYVVYIFGTAMNRAFLVYVVLVAVSLAALLDGVVRLRPEAWSLPASERLVRGTGWFLAGVAALFAALWLATLLPFALGGTRPDPEGPGGSPFPIFVLDLAIVLPWVALVGVLLLHRQPVAGPLTVVVIVKIITLFTTLWAGTVAGILRDDDVHLGADALPSVLMLATCCWLVVRWWREVAVEEPGRRSDFWPQP